MKLLKSENFIIFLVPFLLACAGSIYLNFGLKFTFGDALVRSYHAYLVFFGYEPKLASIGFVWPPLQTFLELPLVLIQPLNTYGIAGNILSSIFFGLTVIYMNLLANLFKVKKIIKFIVLFLFATNPLILFYGINGMSEIIGICFVIMMLYYFLKYLQTKTIPSLILSGFALSCAIITRWEMGILLFIILGVIFYKPFFDKKFTFREVESSLIIYFFPVIFTIILWLTTCWLITGSFFPGSAQLATDGNNTGTSIDVKTLWFAVERMILMSPLFILLFSLSLPKLFSKSRLQTLAIFGFSLSILFAQTIIFSLGRSVGELRYFIYIIPFTYIMLFLLLKDTLSMSLKGIKKLLILFTTIIMLIISSIFTFYVMSSEKYNSQEHIFIEALFNNYNNSQFYNYEKDKKISEYISSHVSSRSILVDDSEAFSIIYFTQKPYFFIQTGDSDYKKILKNPIENKVKYILINDIKKLSTLNELNSTYPTMFNEGADFVTLEKDFGKWKLYRIITPGEKLTENLQMLQNFQLTQPKKKTICEHTVVYGETLWSISKKYIGEGKDFEKISSQNKELIIDARVIHPGKKIVVPCPNES